MEYIHMPPAVLICIVIVCIVLLIGGISAQLAVSVAVLAVVVHVLNAAQKRKSKRDTKTVGTFNTNPVSLRARTGTRPRQYHHPIPVPAMYQQPISAQIQKQKPKPTSRTITGGGITLQQIQNHINDSRYKCIYNAHAAFKHMVKRFCADTGDSTKPQPEMSDTYIVCLNNWHKAADKWLAVVKDETWWATYNRADVYRGKCWQWLMTRLITRPSLIFLSSNDRHCTAPSLLSKPDDTIKVWYRTGYDPGNQDTTTAETHVKGTDNGSAGQIGRTHTCLTNTQHIKRISEFTLADFADALEYPSINDTLSYEEMQLAALLGISAHTRFTGTGVPGETTCACTATTECEHELDGILVGLTGERFDSPGVMGHRTMFNTVYTNSLDDVVIEHIGDTSGDLSFTEICTGCNYYTTPFRTYNATGGYVSNQINGTRFIRRLMIPVRLLLDDAVRRIKTKPFAGRKLYVVATGLGCDTHKPENCNSIDIDLINLYAWISCIFDDKYKGIPLIEYRQQSTHIEGVEHGTAYWLSCAIDEIITRPHITTDTLKSNSAAIEQILYKKQAESHVFVWKITHTHTPVTESDSAGSTVRYFMYREYAKDDAKDWGFARSVKSIKSRGKLSDTEKDCYNAVGDTPLLVSMFPRGPNSYVGNDFWDYTKPKSGAYENASTAAATLCSEIAITMNPDINQEALWYGARNGKLVSKTSTPDSAGESVGTTTPYPGSDNETLEPQLEAETPLEAETDTETDTETAEAAEAEPPVKADAEAVKAADTDTDTDNKKTGNCCLIL